VFSGSLRVYTCPATNASGRQLIVTWSVAVLVTVPDVPVIVNGKVPTEAAGLAEIVSVELPPPAATEVGESVAVILDGTPETLRATEVEFPATVTVAGLLDLRLTVIEAGDTDTAKVLAGAFTVTVKVTECERPPAVPVTMTL